MKRLAAVTTSLLLTLTAAGGAMSAFAEQSETTYPGEESFIKTLEFDKLTDYDYDAESDTWLFADGDILCTYVNGKREQAALSESEYEFSSSQSAVIIGNYTFNLNGTTLKVADFDGDEMQTFDGEYSSLKQFGNKAYAIKGKVLYSFENTQEPAPVLLKFVDYEVTRQIPVGQAAEALKNYETLEFVTVNAGAFLTAVDLTSLDGEYFTLENTEEGVNISVNTVTFEEDTTALLLCHSGNAAIVSIGDSSFVTLNTSITEKTDVNCKTEANFKATVTGNIIYASPFTVKGTTRLPDATGTIVTVTGKLEYENVLNSVYYEVEYDTPDGAVKGYVAEGLLFKGIIEDTKQPETKPDPEYSESTGVTTVLLILAVVVLVLIALGYLAHTATSGKKKKKEKQNEEAIN